MKFGEVANRAIAKFVFSLFYSEARISISVLLEKIVVLKHLALILDFFHNRGLRVDIALYNQDLKIALKGMYLYARQYK